jgi:hypothetical protein
MSCGIKHILTLSEAIVFNKVNIYDSLDRDITQNCKFSWSTDRVCWTTWATMDEYEYICPNLESDFYLRISIPGIFNKITVGNMPTKCYDICLDSNDTFLLDFCKDENLFNPYSNLECALELYKQTSNSIVCMFGIPAFYFRVVPRKDTVDYTFKEYVLHNVESIKQIKILIPDGQMPSSNPKFSELDFEWEAPWEVEIGKDQFAQAFGDTAFPKYQDFIYVPLMKRMWDVNAAYEEKNEGFMWRSVTWKLQLTKYNDSTNVLSEGFDDIIDTWVVNNYEDTFGKIEKIEQEREVGALPLSAPKFSATNLCDIFMEDSIRKQYTKNDISIINKQYNHKSNIFARNYYRFKNENACVVYQKGYCGDCGTLIFLLETQGTLGENIEKNIIEFGPVCINMKFNKQTEKFSLEFNGSEQELDVFSTYMVVCKWNRSLFNTELIIYKYTHDGNIPVYKLRPEMYYFDVENPLCERMNHYDNDYVVETPQLCQVHAYPLFLSNIKLYNRYLDYVETLKEMIKYTTTHENCVINDLARPISSGHGYDVK